MQKTQLISIIRNSINAANAAAVMLENVECGACIAVMGACSAYEPCIPAQTEPATLTCFQQLMHELNDPRFTLRSVTEMCAKTGYSDFDDIEHALAMNDIDFVIMTRRSDGAKLIGLASRN